MRLAVAALTAALMIPLAVLSAGAGPAGAGTTPPGLPQTKAADTAATWLAKQINAEGYIAGSGSSADLSDTAQAVLALAATGTQQAKAKSALSYLSTHVKEYIAGGDAPGELATLILAATAFHQDAADFGGTDLVSKLFKTMQQSGRDAGLFGKSSSAEYDGAYRQGLALVALAAVHWTGPKVQPAVTWLKDQQCANGSWMAYRSSTSTPCPPADPADYTGPDSNSTSLAVQGLVAQGASFKSPRPYLAKREAPDGGWGYYGKPSDPDSTSLVIQALVADHLAVSSGWAVKGGDDPVSCLLSYRVTGGAFTYPGNGHKPDLLATEQAIPALLGKALPY